MNILRYKEFISKHIVLVIGIISVLAYLNTLTHGFVYDDSYFSNRNDLSTVVAIPRAFIESYIPNNRTAGFYRPFAIASFAATFAMFGSSPTPFHLSNILFHAIASVLVFYFIRAFKFSRTVAIIVALLFAVHPIHVDAVANIKSRDEIFYAIFLMLSVMSFLHSSRAKYFLGTFIVSLFTFFFGLCSKEMAITIPVLCVGTVLFQRMPWRRFFLFILGWGSVVALYSFLRYQALGQYFIGTYTNLYPANELYITSLTTKILTAFQIYILYIRLFIFPSILSATYGYAHIVPVSSPSISWTWVLGLVAGAITLVGFILTLQKHHFKTAFVILAWGLLYLPSSQLLGVMGDVAAERWMYAPSIFFFLLCALLYTKLVPQRYVYISIIVISALLFVRTIFRNPVWTNNLTIYESMVRSAPESVHAQTALAQEYFFQGKIVDARKHAELAVKIYPSYPAIYEVFGRIAARTGKWDEALKNYQKSLELNPKNLQVYSLIGRLYFNQGLYDKAEQQFLYVASNIRYFSVDDTIALAATYAKLKKYKESLKILSTLSSKDRTKPEVQFILAVDFYKQGDKEKVLQYIRWNPALTREERETLLENF